MTLRGYKPDFVSPVRASGLPPELGSVIVPEGQPVDWLRRQVAPRSPERESHESQGKRFGEGARLRCSGTNVVWKVVDGACGYHQGVFEEDATCETAASLPPMFTGFSRLHQSGTFSPESVNDGLRSGLVKIVELSVGTVEMALVVKALEPPQQLLLAATNQLGEMR